MPYHAKKDQFAVKKLVSFLYGRFRDTDTVKNSSQWKAAMENFSFLLKIFHIKNSKKTKASTVVASKWESL